MRFPALKYPVIHADPAWRFDNWSEAGEDRNAKSHYACMSLEDMARLPIDFCADDDCALFMWATYPMLLQALELGRRWGFKYKTVAFTWAKKNRKADSFFMGLGYWTRSNPEVCLLFTRGHPERKAKNVRNLIVSPIREHSRKPDETYERIEQLLDGPYLDLFSRQRRAGWDCWGNEVEKFKGVAA